MSFEIISADIWIAVENRSPHDSDTVLVHLRRQRDALLAAHTAINLHAQPLGLRVSDAHLPHTHRVKLADVVTDAALDAQSRVNDVGLFLLPADRLLRALAAAEATAGAEININIPAQFNVSAMRDVLVEFARMIEVNS